MKKLYYILALLIISTGYLFPKSERNKDTVIKLDTAIVKESVVDTVVIEKSVNVKKENDLIKYYFYNDYLDYIKKNNSINDTILINKCKKTGIISGQIGTGILIGVVYSMALDIPINCKINITSKYATGIAGMHGANRFSSLGIGLGYVATKTNYFILKLNVYPSLELYKKEQKLGVNIGADILLKVVEPCYMSINSEFYAVEDGFTVMISLGLNLVY
jgi:hypothetical protein